MTLAHDHQAPTASDDADRTLATCVSEIIARRQGIQSLAGAIIAGVPAHLCCVFQSARHTLEYNGGVEAIPSERVRKPAARVIARMATLAAHAVADTQIRQHTTSYRHAAWPALLTVPLITDLGQTAGVLVIGRRDRVFVASEIVAVQEVAPQIAAYILLREPVASSQTATRDYLSASGVHCVATISAEDAGLPDMAVIGDALFHSTDEAALVIDAHYTIQQHNPAAQQMTGWDEAIIGKRCLDVLRCRDGQDSVLCGTAHCPLVGTQTAHPVPRATVQIETFHHARRTVSAGAVRLDTGERHSLLLLRDIEPLLAVMHQRDEFLSEVSHKMRNRLNTIHGFIELVASGHAGAIDERQQLLLSYAHTSSIELMEYVENLLYLTRLDSNQLSLHYDTLDIPELLEEVEHYTLLEASNAQVTLTRDTLPPLPVIRGDRERLRQALLNLATNAVKFTPAGGTVRLSAFAADNTLTVLVADTGAGIAPIDQPYIFERDYQSERAAQMNKSGGGMGLATAKAIVEQHGGTIRFETVLDQGTTFFVQLPCVQPHDLDQH
jgi:signal transduction histidine kinase